MSLKVAVIPVTPLQQNCTVMWDEDTMTGVVIDPGGDVTAIKDAIEGLGIKIEKILLTHGHFDHIGGAMELAEDLEVPIVGPHKEDAYITTTVTERGPEFGVPDGRNVEGNQWLNEGDTVTFGNQTLDVLHTPGTPPDTWSTSIRARKSPRSATCCSKAPSGAPTWGAATTPP